MMRAGSWLVGAIGVALSLLGWTTQPLAFRHAWLAGLTVWLEWPLGSLALLLVHALTGGDWGSVLRPALLAGVATLPLLLPALVPVVAHLHGMYPWARDGADFANGFWLNTPFFAGRGVVYLVVWFGLAALVVRALSRGASLARLAPPGLILLALTATFAAIDTTLSLDPSFNSSVWGMIAAAGSGLLALAVAVLVTALMSRRAVPRDFGRLLLGLVVLWAYLDFMQFLIVWESDLAVESSWYAARSTGVWGDAAALIALGHFLLPFAALIFPAVQRSRIGMIAVCGWLIAMEALHAWWLVLPAEPRGVWWLDLAALMSFAGLGAGLAQSAPRAEPTYV
jgi:hypothetical protein